MITPRSTRLVRTADLHVFRHALISLATEGSPFEARDRLLVVPTRAAGAHLLRTIEATVPTGAAVLRPDVITPSELVSRLASRLLEPPVVLRDTEREALFGVACRVAHASGAEPPFRLRPGLVAEALRFYDELGRQQKSIDDFERLMLGRLEPSASDDRGAERLAMQTRFLVAAFRAFALASVEHGLDEHGLRRLLLATPAKRPYRHIVLAVTSRAFASPGLVLADWDLLTRLPGLERLDVVTTDTRLAGAPHEWFHRTLPGIEEVRVELATPSPMPTVLVPAEGVAHVARDREEEVAGFARRARRAVHRGDARTLDHVALIVPHPLPYLYIARDVLQSASTPCQTLDALPLAAEPVAAALDLVLSCAASSFTRDACMALLRSPFFNFDPTGATGSAAARVDWLADIAALDRALAEAGYLGERGLLEGLIDDAARGAAPSRKRRQVERAARAGAVLLDVIGRLEALDEPAPVATHLAVVLAFWHAHERRDLEAPSSSRRSRARAALLTVLTSLRDAYARFDDAPVTVDDVAALVRRAIESHTFALASGDEGVHIVDAVSAPFGEFDVVQVAGLVEGEWPEPARHETFYSASLLRDLDWPTEADRLDGLRAAFLDLLRLPTTRLAVSTFRLERDALVSPSPLIEELDRTRLVVEEEPPWTGRIFDYEALAVEPLALDALATSMRDAGRRRLARVPAADARFHGRAGTYHHAAYSLSALERYETCPFKFFADDVLHLEEGPEDSSTISPRMRGKFLHEVFQRFFDVWDSRDIGTVTPERMAEARGLMADVAEPLLARLPTAEGVLERARLFGSAMAPGAVELVLGFEASRPERVTSRWLEHRFEGDFTLGGRDGRRVPLVGIADRIDLLDDGRLRVVDYKSGEIWDRGKALQVPVYALCAQDAFPDASGARRDVAEAGYITLGGKQAFVPMVKASDPDAGATLDDARQRVLAVVDAVSEGTFPPKPRDLMDCRFCPYPAVCRKDYVGDE